MAIEAASGAPGDARAGGWVPLLACVPMLLWPAALNGYPLVFSDTGTYLSQAIDRHLGWDRPPVYSLVLWPLHLTTTTWPVVVAQAVLVAHTLHLLRRCLLPAASAWCLPGLVAALAAAGPLPFLVSQLIPDLFAPLLVLSLCLLALWPERLSRRERIWLALVSAGMIAAHTANLLLALALLAVLLPTRWALAAHRGAGVMLLVPPVLAVAALLAINLAGFGRLGLAPFGHVFLLARVLYDGPGMETLRAQCPGRGWRLCGQLDRLPDSADGFLWRADSPLNTLGGARALSAEAGEIIVATLRRAPAAELRAMAGNGLRQLGMFATGDGLAAWPRTVTPVIERDFPAAEIAAYRRAQQTQGGLVLPVEVQIVHAAAALLGVLATGACLAAGWARQRRQVAALCGMVLLALVANAAITGGLSGPHDRYQSRMMWLPVLTALLAVPALRAGHPAMRGAG